MKLNKLYDLTGKTALITGGGGLLGAEHAIALANNGAQIILTDINNASLEKAQRYVKEKCPDVLIRTYELDITNEEAIYAAEEFFSSQGGVDILINNAAIDAKVTEKGNGIEMSRLEHFSLAQWNTELNVGLTGAFLCSKVFGTQMATRSKGVILNIASDLSVISPDQRLYRQATLPTEQQPVKPVTYSVLKAGLIGLTRYLSTYWADKGVRANALSPGGVYVDQPDSFVSLLTERIPLGRMANRSEYWGVVQFLCSDASEYLTGQNIVMDGGRSVW